MTNQGQKVTLFEGVDGKQPSGYSSQATSGSDARDHFSFSAKLCMHLEASVGGVATETKVHLGRSEFPNKFDRSGSRTAW
jgi:hypothetical protein